MQEEVFKEKKEREKEKKKTRQRERAPMSTLLHVGEEVLWGCAAWLLGRAELLFGTYPLGLALLCGSEKHTVSILVGLILTAVSNMHSPVVYICTYVAAAVVRIVASLALDFPNARLTFPSHLREKLQLGEKAVPRSRLARLQKRIRLRVDEKSMPALLWEELGEIFTESICLRITTAGVCSMIVSLYHIIANGFLYYDLFGAVFALVVTPVGATAYSAITSSSEKNRILRRISGGVLMLTLVYAAKGVSFLGFALSPIAALFFSFYTCGRLGSALGIVASLLCGIAYDPLYAPSFLLASLVFLFFYRMKKESAALLLGCGSAVCWAVYVGGADMLLRMVPATLIAGSAYTVYEKLTRQREESDAEQEEETEATDLQMEHSRRKDATERFRGISDAFSSLSEMFYNLSDRFRRPGTLDLRRICDDAFDCYCSDCPNKTVCWGLEYSQTLASVNELITALHTRGRVNRKEPGEHLLHRCTRIDSVLEKINRECARLTGEMLRNNRTEIFAMDYESAADIINDALEEENGEYCFDAELARRVGEYLSDAGIRFGGVTVYGSRRRRILVRGADVAHAKVSTETLRADLGEMCGSELSPPLFEVENGVSTMILQAKQMLAVMGAQNNVSADGGVSGDSVNLFSNKRDYFYALISDGMGAGKEAALTSGLCSVFMEKMLRAGNRASTSLRMLNNMIASRGADSTRECSSTIDLLELDLMTGESAFIKSGAAPSFIVRDGVVRRLQSGTVPIGILCHLDAQKTCFQLKAGDTVVMVSDGILQGDADSEWLGNYLAGAGERDPQEIVYRICLHAAEHEEHDDCSAIALRIQAAEN